MEFEEWKEENMEDLCFNFSNYLSEQFGKFCREMFEKRGIDEAKEARADLIRKYKE